MRLTARSTGVPTLGAAAALVAAALLTGCSGSAHSSDPTSATPSAGVTSGSAASGATSSATSSGVTSGGATSPTGSGSGASSGGNGSGSPVAPVSGNIHQTIPSRTVQTKAPVAPRRPAAFGGGVTVTASAITAITTVAHGPGEIGGPGLEITLLFHNGSGRAIDLDDVVVNLFDSTEAPAIAIDGAPAAPVSGQVPANASKSGRYVFTIAKTRRTPITISVSYTPNAPVVQIVGNAG